MTAREFELLEILIKNENKVYSRESLLKIVWGEDYPGDVRTVDVMSDVFVKRLRQIQASEVRSYQVGCGILLQPEVILSERF